MLGEECKSLSTAVDVSMSKMQEGAAAADKDGDGQGGGKQAERDAGIRDCRGCQLPPGDQPWGVQREHLQGPGLCPGSGTAKGYQGPNPTPSSSQHPYPFPCWQGKR